MYIPPPETETLSLNMQSVTVGLLSRFNVAPSLPEQPTCGKHCMAVFPMNVQLATVGLLPFLYIPPPFSFAELLIKVVPVSTGLLVYKLDIPPPFSLAELLIKVVPVSTGLLVYKLDIPPPLEAAVLLMKVTLVRRGLLS